MVNAADRHLRVHVARVRCIWLSAAILFNAYVVGQVLEDTVRLNEVEVAAPRLVGVNVGAHVVVLDSATMARHANNDLGTLLTNESSVFIKNYGPGSLATTAFRGGSASHTAVLWNGFNIGSPMNGQLDLSLVPVFAANDVRIEHGGATALWGSGAVGGTIHLNDLPRFGRGVHAEAGLSFGSFTDRRQQVKVSLANARWSASLGVYNVYARNDFEFSESENGSTRRQENAQMEQRGLVAQVHHQLNARQRITLGYWFQDSERGIPPTLHQASSSAEQRDASHRITAGWRYFTKQSMFQVRGAMFHEDLLWFPFGDTAVASRSNTSIGEVEWRYRPQRGHLLHVGLHATHASAISDGYPDRPEQLRTAIFGAYTFTTRNERWSLSASVRQERMDERQVPFTGSVGAEVKLAKGVRGKANASKLYRVPTFNDLYWVPGGVRELKPEEGQGAEIGIAVDRTARGVVVKADATTYSRTMDQWIIWLPGALYWSPQNLMRVWSRGVETSVYCSIPLERTKLILGVNTDHVVSTNQRAKGADDASVDKQLIYTPMYSGRLRLGMERGGFSMTCAAVYTGYRYTSTDNRSYLEPYTVVNAWMAYTFKVGERGRLSVDAQGNNLFDVRYQVVADRPMPLRNFRIGVRYQFGER